MGIFTGKYGFVVFMARENPDSNEVINIKVPEGQKLIVCKGHEQCQRNFRSLICRSFPFFPYLSRQGELIGLSYFWDFEDRCWIISNLNSVSQEFRSQFMLVYDFLFEQTPETKGALSCLFLKHAACVWAQETCYSHLA